MTNNTQASQQVPSGATPEQQAKSEFVKIYGDKMFHSDDWRGFRRGWQALLAQSATATTEDAKLFLQQDDLDTLCRINANFEDGQGHTASKETMARLAELGVIRTMGFGRYCITVFGSWLIHSESRMPLRTFHEQNLREMAGLELYNDEGFNGTAWINLSDDVRESWRDRAALSKGNAHE